MRRIHHLASVIAAVSLMACATTSDEDEDPQGITSPEVNGFATEGSVGEIVTVAQGRAYPNIQFNVKVELRNTSDASSTFAYRTSCPVLLRLYANDGRKVYDETGRDCGEGSTSLTVPSGAERTLFSGVRFPNTVLGDSIPPGRYRVVAVVQRDEGAIQVEAGTYNIPLCDGDGCRPAGTTR